MIIEVPPEAQVHGAKQYKLLSEDDAWTSIKIDGCTHGQRFIVPGPGGVSTVGYCQKVWEYFAANVKLPPKSSDKCQSNHVHVDDDCMCVHADKGKRTGQVSRRLLNALKFTATIDGRLRAVPVSIPRGPVDRVVANLNDSGICFAGPKSAKGEESLQESPAHTCAIRGIAFAIRCWARR